MNNSKKKYPIFEIFFIIAIVSIVSFIVFASNDESDNTINGCPGDKTFNEMTKEEEEACRKYFEEKFESGEWSFE